MQSLRMPIEGMTCQNCARGVERKLSATAGVRKATVTLEEKSVTVEYDEGQVKPEALAAAVRQLGYQVPA